MALYLGLALLLLALLLVVVLVLDLVLELLQRGKLLVWNEFTLIVPLIIPGNRENTYTYQGKGCPPPIAID